MKYWYVYIAECRDGSLYTGIAVDPQARLAEHNLGKGSAYVRSRHAATLVYVERKRDRSGATKRECEIKSWPRTKKLALITGAGPDGSVHERSRTRIRTRTRR